jgi:probable HAF family extracellular repeat protein
MKNVIKLTFLFVILSVLSLVNISYAVEYQIIDLGVIGGYGSVANGINNYGQIVGESSTDYSGGRAFLYENGSMTDIGTINNYCCSQGKGINDSGQVVGSSSDYYGYSRAFLYDNGLMKDLGTFGGHYGSAESINNNGQVVGWAYTNNDFYSRAFLYENGIMKDIGTLGGRANSAAYSINNKGQIVGGTYPPAYSEGRAFLYENGVMKDLGTLGGLSSKATGINESSQVVGYSQVASGFNHAFLYENNIMKDIGTLGGNSAFAYGINNSGQIVGSSQTNTNNFHAFLYDDGIMIDLGTLGGSNSTAKAINERGQIIGSSNTITGEQHAVLWQPIISIDIDIKPGSFPNNINPKSKGKIPVAILSTKDFNALSQIDLNSLTFGRTGDERSLAFCHASEDVNRDGLQDLLCHFYTEDTGFQCSDTEGILKGETKDGMPIQGSDSVNIVPCEPKVYVKVNGSHLPIIVDVGETVEVTVSMEAGDKEGSMSEKWLGILGIHWNYWYTNHRHNFHRRGWPNKYTSGKWVHSRAPMVWDRGPIGTFEKQFQWTFNNAGVYLIMFASDEILDGKLGTQYVDHVVVTVKSR